jgi:hypothetical protein
LKAKGNLKVVTERVGHASVSLTFDVYSHVLPDMQQTVNEKLETLLFRKTGTQMAHKMKGGQSTACKWLILIAPAGIRTPNDGP